MRHIRTIYSLEIVEGLFSEVELRLYGVLRSSPSEAAALQTSWPTWVLIDSYMGVALLQEVPLG